MTATPRSPAELEFRRRPGRLERYRPTPQERREIMDALALRPEETWWFRFTFMLTLSGVIAAMGLSANSAAVVIGAMLVAPLMTPILALAASIAMGWALRTMHFTGVVLAASASVVVTGFVLALLVPDVLPPEVLARTSPDVRDLLVALAAGLAGAYATVRRGMSSSLPGVAVAVALVPPLVTAGYTLEAGRAELSRGALLLFATNLVAILLSGVVVFVTTGFVPPRRLAKSTPRVLVGVGVVAACLAGVAVPLVRSTLAAAESAKTLQAVNIAVEQWLDGTELEVDRLEVDEALVRLDVAGPVAVPDKSSLLVALRSILGTDVVAEIGWTQRSRSLEVLAQVAADDPAGELGADPTSDTAAALGSSGSAVGTADGGTVEQADLEPTVRLWLGRTEFEDLDVAWEGGDAEIAVEVVGPEEPPPVEPLTLALRSLLGRDVEVSVSWTERLALEEATGEPDGAPGALVVSGGSEQPEGSTLGLRIAIEAWALTQRPVPRFVAVERADGTVTVELASTADPDTASLAAALAPLLDGDDLEVRLYVARVVPVPSATSTAPPATSTTTPGAPGATPDPAVGGG
ncbi:MAG: TIGR00341 family protein [Acidimicrobiia bacterium]|nr:TIGR00341 family protein [Acidimicrobiia bacterium]